MRVIFTEIDEFKKWIDTFVREDRHVVYLTKYREIIVTPKVSTKPIILAYMKMNEDAEVSDVINHLPEGVIVFGVKSFDWKDDTPIGASFLV